jgi:hypothetical protein
LNDLVLLYNQSDAPDLLGSVLARLGNSIPLETNSLSLAEDVLTGTIRDENPNLLNTFIQLGLDIHGVPKDGGTLLHSAIKLARNFSDNTMKGLGVEAVKCLVENGVDPCQLDAQDFSAMDFCDMMLGTSKGQAICEIRECLETLPQFTDSDPQPDNSESDDGFWNEDIEDF